MLALGLPLAASLAADPAGGGSRRHDGPPRLARAPVCRAGSLALAGLVAADRASPVASGPAWPPARCLADRWRWNWSPPGSGPRRLMFEPATRDIRWRPAAAAAAAVFLAVWTTLGDSLAWWLDPRCGPEPPREPSVSGPRRRAYGSPSWRWSPPPRSLAPVVATNDPTPIPRITCWRRHCSHNSSTRAAAGTAAVIYPLRVVDRLERRFAEDRFAAGAARPVRPRPAERAARADAGPCLPLGPIGSPRRLGRLVAGARDRSAWQSSRASGAGLGLAIGLRPGYAVASSTRS